MYIELHLYIKLKEFQDILFKCVRGSIASSFIQMQTNVDADLIILYQGIIHGVNPN